LSDAACSTFELLVRSAPTWAEVTCIYAEKVHVRAAPARASGLMTRNYTLLVTLEVGELTVRESEIENLLPKFCPERHVNDGGSFCLGIHAGSGIDNDYAARAWWRKLKVFLTCQDTAQETGRWPDFAQLSHGEAGEIEVEAEIVANSLDRLADFRRAVRFDAGPIALGLSKVNKSNGQLLNGRAACLCGRVDRRGRAVLRRTCHKLGCPVELEFKRRQATRRFWKAMNGRACCRSMLNCPLNKRRDEGPAN
jgi:hypothetical protein